MPSQPDATERGAGQLRTAWLDRVDFKVNRDWTPGTDVRYTLDYGSEVSFGDGDDASVATVWLFLKIEWRNLEDELVDAGPFELEVVVGGVYDWTKAPVDRGIFEAWVEWNGVYLLWPYARGYIASITADSFYPALTINTLRVPDAPAAKIAEIARALEGQAPPADEV